MTNYSMQQGRRRNDKIKFIKRFFLGFVVAWTLMYGITQLVKFWDNQSNKILSIDYCWDSNGRHYVAPNQNCNN